MSAPPFTLEARAAQLVVDLESVLTTLREGIAAGGLSVVKQRYLVRELREAPRLVSELRGAVEAYREIATHGRPAALAPIADDARPLHLSDEEMR